MCKCPNASARAQKMIWFTNTKMLNVKRIGAGLLTLSFIVGVLIVPTLHRAHCADHHDAHEAASCAICQLAHTTVIATASVIAPIASFIKLGDVVLLQSFIASSFWRDPTRARAPPLVA